MSSEPPQIGLALSGGGFRATLFHLGVVRFLHEAGLLASVKRIGAVSGGSILAAHLGLNWEKYVGKEFDIAAQEIINFVREDIRGNVIRRWILAWVTLIPRLLKPKRWTFTTLLQGYYDRLFQHARLKDLGTFAKCPEIFFNCASLGTGQPCSFGQLCFMWSEKGKEKDPISSPNTRVDFAVAASSAFPPLFPPIAISHEILSCDIEKFPNPFYLTDGGVYDNLGNYSPLCGGMTRV
jgi:predicted acylesterase/phospholipase RssA